ncbi:MAG: ABC transporter permease subunit [Clostridia bacterium]|nr:ABC transporter permease subunit [Clostridia bacterium]
MGRRAKTAADPLPARKRSGLLHEIKKHYVLFLMVLPAIVYFIVFCYIPMPGVYIAFVNYNIGKGIFGSPFVGLKNFSFLIRTGKLWLITKNTLLYNLVFLALGNFFQIAFAIMLSEIACKPYKRVTQSVILLPNFISYVIVGVFAFNMFNYDYGFINSLLVSAGQARHAFYMDEGIWKYIIVAFKLWHDTGYGMIVYLAVITGMDQEIYEAAKIDGATEFQRIRYLTIPMLKSTFVMLFVFGLGGVLNGSFDLFYNLIGNNSVLFPQTDIIDTFVTRSLTGQFNFSQSAAVGFYQSLFGLILVLSINTIVRKVDPENALF